MEPLLTWFVASLIGITLYVGGLIVYAVCLLPRLNGRMAELALWSAVVKLMLHDVPYTLLLVYAIGRFMGVSLLGWLVLRGVEVLPELRASRKGTIVKTEVEVKIGVAVQFAGYALTLGGLLGRGALLGVSDVG